MEELQKLIGQVGIFVICAQAIMHFRPKESYSKYLRLLFGVMVLVQILQPFLAVFGYESGGNILSSLDGFQKALESSGDYAGLAQERLEQMTERIATEAVGEGQADVVGIDLHAEADADTVSSVKIRIEPVRIKEEGSGGVP